MKSCLVANENDKFDMFKIDESTNFSPLFLVTSPLSGLNFQESTAGDWMQFWACLGSHFIPSQPPFYLL